MNYQFPNVITWSQISKYNRCPQLFNWSELLGIQPPMVSAHLHAGSVFASAMETLRKSYFFEHLSEKESLEQAFLTAFRLFGDSSNTAPRNKNLGAVLGAIEAYTARFPLSFETFVPQYLEYSFAVAIPEVMHPTTEEPLIFCGRLDALVKAANGCIYGFDDKTTSILSTSWRNQWHISGQFTGYLWAMQQLSIECTGFIIRGTCLKTNGTYEFTEFFIQRSQEQIARWWNGVILTLMEMKERFIGMKPFIEEANLASGVFPLISSYECTHCPYFSLCTARDPINLLHNYQKGRWNPLTRKVEDT